MDDQERARRHERDLMKYNEFHKGGQKEDRTTAEIVEIAAALEDGAIIQCVTWLWPPHMHLSIILDNQLHSRVVDIVLVVSNADQYQFRFKRHNYGSVSRHGADPPRNDFDMSIADVVECFGLDDQKISDPVTPGTWSGWFLLMSAATTMEALIITANQNSGRHCIKSTPELTTAISASIIITTV